MKDVVIYSFQIIKETLLNVLSFILAFFLILLLFSLLASSIMDGLQNEDKLKQAAEKDKLDYSYVSGDKKSDNKLLVLSIEGLILGSSSEEAYHLDFLSMGITYGYALKDILKKVAKDEQIKGILLHLQTPGGTIFGSMAIFEGIRDYQEHTKKPVYAYIEGLAASGGVMAMVAADQIYADYGSMIGSIGVIGPMLNYYDKPLAMDGGLLGKGITTKEGIEQFTLSAGFGKDLGNPFRRPSERELKNLQDGLESEYQNFVSHVAENRKIEKKILIEKMGAQIFSNKQAQEYGLIDATLNREKSIAKLAKKADIEEDFQLVQIKTQAGDFLSQLLSLAPKQKLSSQTSITPLDQVCQHIGTPLVYYGNIAALCQ